MIRFIEAFLLFALQACGVAISEEGAPAYMVNGEEMDPEVINKTREEIAAQKGAIERQDSSTIEDAESAYEKAYKNYKKMESTAVTGFTETITYTVPETAAPNNTGGKIDNDAGESFLQWGTERTGTNPLEAGVNYESWVSTCPVVKASDDEAKRDMNRFNPFLHRNRGYRSPGHRPDRMPGQGELGAYTKAFKGFPRCKSAGLERARGHTVHVDGLIDDWQGKGLVAWDRYGDGILNHPSLDLIGVYLAEDDDHWYMFVMLGREFRAAPPGSRMDIQILNWTNSIAADKVEDSWTWDRGIRVLPNGKIDEGAADSDRFRVVSGPDGVEIAIARAPYEKAGASRPAVKVSVSHTCTDAEDQSRRIFFGLRDGPSCLADLPNGSFKAFVHQWEEGTSPEDHRDQADKVAIAMPLVEEITGDHVSNIDTMTSVTANYIHAGGYYNRWHHYMQFGPTWYWNGDKDDPMPLSFSTAAHEYAHALNSGSYKLPASWMTEGHSSLIDHLVDSYYRGYKTAVHARFADWIMEEEAGKDPVDLMNWGDKAPICFYYAKAETMHANFMRAVGKDRYLETLRTKMRDLADSYKGDGWQKTSMALNPLTSLSGFPGENERATFDGWLSARPYNEAFGRPDFRVEDREPMDGDEDGDGDGIPDAVELGLGSNPAAPLDAPVFIADHYPGDWERAKNIFWEEEGGDTSIRCPVDLDISRAAAILDGKKALFAMELTEGVNWNNVSIDFWGDGMAPADQKNRGYLSMSSHLIHYYSFDGYYSDHHMSEGFYLRRVPGRFIEWSASLEGMFKVRDLSVTKDSMVKISVSYDGTFCDGIEIPVQHLSKVEFL